MRIHKFKVFIFGGLLTMLFLPLLGTTSTWATIESIKDSPSSLFKAKDYDQAMRRCLPKLKNFTYGPSDASTSGYTDNMVSKAPGFSNQNFFIYDDSLTHWSGTNITVYSTLIEEDNGAFWGGDNNGNLYCGEKESGILKSAMTAFGTDSPEMIKSLVCAGNSTGIYTITKTKIGTNQSDSNCSENYDLLMDYISRPENNPAYQITVTPSGDAVGHYSNWFRDNVGDFSSLNDQQNKASDYAKAATYFQNYCVEDGPSENSFSSTNEVQVWDTFSGKGSAEKAVYYKFKSQPSKPMLLNIDSDATSSCEDVAAMLTEEGAKAYAAESSISGETLDSGTVTGTADEVSGEEQADCYNSGGAKSLGWIMCPIMELMTDATEYLYNNVVEPGLRVQPILFAKGDSPTHQAWSTFRDIANMLFVIIVLVVIFSQITGVGIDNYGIKKILPKLIIVAILVNLSYFLCQACVDVSNILGNFLRTMFNNISTPATGMTEIDGVSTTLAFVGIAVAMLGSIAVLSDTANILALFVGLLGVVISILFLFLLLAARQAAIVVLIVLSPLAVICYALPNTKSISDKWIKFFEGLLMVYPIAGILIGGGDFVSRLLLSTGFAEDNFVTAFTAMIVGIVPIFFIPTVLRSAFAAMGNIGAKISGMGNQLGRMATSGIRGTQRYKDMGQRMHANSERRKLGMDRDGNLTAKGVRRSDRRRNGFARLVGADRRHAARIAEARKDLATGEEARAMLANSAASQGIAALAGRTKEQLEEGDTGNAVEDYYRHQFREAAKKGDISGMNAALQAAEASGQMRPGQMADLLRSAVNQGELDNIGDEAQKAAWMRETAAKYGDGFMAKDYELKHYMQNAGKINGQSVKLGAYGEYAQQAVAGNTMSAADLKPEDVTKMSTNSMAALAQAGVLSSSMAQQVKADNPNIGQDQDVLLGAIADGRINYDGATAKDIADEAKSLAIDSNAAKQYITASRSQIDTYKQSTPTRVEVVNQGPQPRRHGTSRNGH